MPCPGRSAKAFSLTNAFQLLVIIDTSGAFAEADLWPEIEVDLDAALRRLGYESPADAH
jgi:hypothetical protein